MVSNNSILRTLGIFSVLMGIVFLFNAFSRITGYVVLDQGASSLRYPFAVVFLLIGVLIFYAGLER